VAYEIKIAKDSYMYVKFVRTFRYW